LGSAARGSAQDDKVDAGNVSVHNKRFNEARPKGHDAPRERTAEEPAGNLMMPLEGARGLQIAKEPISLEAPIGDATVVHLVRTHCS
jgi:hypothetical protein